MVAILSLVIILAVMTLLEKEKILAIGSVEANDEINVQEKTFDLDKI